MFLRSQKNSLYTTITEHGLTLRDFKLVESNELRLIHIQTGYYYRIIPGEASTASGTKEARLGSLLTPNFTAPLVTIEEVQFSRVRTWEEILTLVNRWLAWIKAEVEQPDLWAEMEHTPHLFADETEIEDGDEYFTPAEIKQLEERVAEVEQRVLALNLPPEVEAAVTETIRDVPSKAKRFTKKELADCIIGSLVKEGFKWGLTTDHMAAAWHGIQHFFAVLSIGQ